LLNLKLPNLVNFFNLDISFWLFLFDIVYSSKDKVRRGYIVHELFPLWENAKACVIICVCSRQWFRCLEFKPVQFSILVLYANIVHLAFQMHRIGVWQLFCSKAWILCVSMFTKWCTSFVCNHLFLGMAGMIAPEVLKLEIRT
jgi:hypothetical protein